ncbi:MAG: hypothetical protein JSU63_04995 [Phycisphaerales bacterium]|nr:MAG: hypothetical protein JSU63_04995 [Phycisphaerales bacterium]
MVRHPPVRTRTIDNLHPTAVTPVVEGSESAVEAHLGQLEDKLTLLKAQVHQAQQLAGLGTAAAMFAHEVSNLLTPILAYAQRALEEDDQPLQRKALTVTTKNVHMLMAMSERILEISAAKPTNRQAVPVKTVANDAQESLCRDLAKDGIRFIVKVDESLTVWADPLQLQQVLFNLFLNARSAMSASHNGRLTVTGACEGGEVVIEVKDTGKGIAPDLLTDVFNALQTSKPVEGDGPKRCAGLGLALCRDLIEENGGSISVASSLDEGTTFTIRLPAEEPTGNQPDSPQQ